MSELPVPYPSRPRTHSTSTVAINYGCDLFRTPSHNLQLPSSPVRPDLLLPRKGDYLVHILSRHSRSKLSIYLCYFTTELLHLKEWHSRSCIRNPSRAPLHILRNSRTLNARNACTIHLEIQDASYLHCGNQSWPQPLPHPFSHSSTAFQSCPSWPSSSP